MPGLVVRVAGRGRASGCRRRRGGGARGHEDGERAPGGGGGGGPGGPGAAGRGGGEGAGAGGVRGGLLTHVQHRRYLVSLFRFDPVHDAQGSCTTMKTFTATPDDISHDWHVVDAAGVPLGRLASAVAQLIRGKHKPTYTPAHGRRRLRRRDQRREGAADRPQAGQQEVLPPHRLHGARAASPPRATCWPSIPTGSSRRPSSACCPRPRSAKQKLRGKLKVYAGAEHPHAAQQPKPFSVTPSKVSA